MPAICNVCVKRTRPNAVDRLGCTTIELLSGLTYYQRWSRGHKARGQGQGHKKIRGQGQGQPFRGQTLSRPRTGMLEAKAKDQGHKRRCPPKKKKKVFTKIFQAIFTKKRFPKNFSSASQNFNNSKNSAVLEPEDRPIFEDLRPRGQGQGLDLRGQGQGLQNVSSRPRTSSRTPPLVITPYVQLIFHLWLRWS